MQNLYIIQPHKTVCRITTNSGKLAELLKLKYGNHISKNTYNSDINIIAIENGTEYTITACGETQKTDSPLTYIDYIVTNNTFFDDDVLALHGAAVEKNGVAYIFLAPSTTGKTTLVSYLALNGCKYITDDCILIDKSSFDVYPFDKPIHLRDGGFEVLKSHNISLPDIKVMDDGTTRRYVFTPEHCTDTPVPLSGIYFINRTENENKVLPMSTNERIMELLKSPITNYTLSAEYLRLISKLASFNCRRLIYSDVEYALKVLENE